MKIIIILGSPRKQGNTSRILNIIKDRLKDTYDVEIEYLSDYEINGCLGCSQCQAIIDKPGCVQKDQANQLLQQLINADVILYGTPLYGHSYSGQLKIFMDRHVALFKFVDGSDKAVGEMEIRSFLQNKPVGLIVSCQGPEEDNTELIQAQFNKFCESSVTKCLGKYIFPFCDVDSDKSEYSEETILRIVHDITNIK